MLVSLVAAASEDNVIGKNGKIPWHLPDDLKFFRELTEGHPVIMGRKTYESIGHPLPKRTNIIVTRNIAYETAGCIVAGSLPDAISKAGTTKTDEAFVIGGGRLYEAALHHAGRVYLTRVHTTIENGDTFFPELNPHEWKETANTFHASDARHAFPFTFLTYERKV